MVECHIYREKINVATSHATVASLVATFYFFALSFIFLKFLNYLKKEKFLQLRVFKLLNDGFILVQLGFRFKKNF